MLLGEFFVLSGKETLAGACVILAVTVLSLFENKRRMSDLESRIVQLTRANRRWKMLAFGLCACVCLFAATSLVCMQAMQARAEESRAVALQAAAAAKLHRDLVEQP